MIVVATDFSGTARLAQQHAVALAKRRGAKVVLVHGHTMGAYWVGPGNPIAVPPNYEDSILKAARESLDTIAEEVRAQGVDAEGRLVAAAGPEAVLDSADSVEADLIVTGTRGHTGFKHLVLGSSAEAIVRRSDRPVLSVHPGNEVPSDGKLRVVLPTDFSDDAKLALDRTLGLLGDGPEDCELILVHVVHTPVLMSPMVGDMGMREVFVQQAREQAVEALDELAASLRSRGCTVEAVVREGDPADVISAVAKEQNADLVAMGTRGLTGLQRIVQGTVADRTVRHAGCPVLTVPRSEPD